MTYLVTSQQMCELDRLTIERYGTPGRVLMERAGAGATAHLLAAFPQLLSNKKHAAVLVLAGKGNNGGDGFVMARLLKKHGLACEVVLAAKRAAVSVDARRPMLAFARGRGRITELTQPDQLSLVRDKLRSCCVVVDALLGTGLNAPVRGLAAELIALVNASGRPVVAVDIPSGLDADRGQPLGTAIRAQLTATFGYPKLGLSLYPGLNYVGRLVVVDIGIAPEALDTVRPMVGLLSPQTVAHLLQPRQPESHKGSFGHLLVLAGARGKSGAALLAASAGLRVGTGLVTLAGPESLVPVFSSALLEAMTVGLPERADGSLRMTAKALHALLLDRTAIAFGPGISVSVDTLRLTRWLLKQSEVPLLIDADGLNCVAAQPDMLRAASQPVVLTPHPGEMARLTGTGTAEVQARRLEIARSFAGHSGCYVVLKGARTVVAAPDGWAWINPTGNPGMASGGMGDALAGIIGGLLAQGYQPAEACQLGVFVHGSAGDLAVQEIGPVGILARDVIDRLPRSLQSLSAVQTDRVPSTVQTVLQP